MKATAFAAAVAITFVPGALGQHRQTVFRGYCRRSRILPGGGHECVITSTQTNWGPYPCPPTGMAWKSPRNDALVYRGCEFERDECTFTTNEPSNTGQYADCAAYLGRPKPVHTLVMPDKTNGRPPNNNDRPQGGKDDGQQGKGNSQQQSKGNTQQQGKGNTPQTKTTRKNTRRGNMRRGNRI